VIKLPPEEASYQLILLPAETALIAVGAPIHTVAGLALTDVGAAGKAETPTVAVAEFEHELAVTV
jgi:hypothetical protein